MFPVLLRVGPLTLHSFGVMLAIAFLVGGELLARELRRRGLDPEWASKTVAWAIVGGLVGARLYYVVERWDEVRVDLAGALLSGSGLVVYGGLAGGVAAAWLALARARAPVLAVSDAASPSLALGYAIGRVGCLLAGDGDYGPPSDRPWAMRFPRALVTYPLPDGRVVPVDVPVHPTPLYESVAMLGVFALLWRLRRRDWPAGRLFALYLAVQGVERFLSEFWRLSPPWLLGLSQAQVISVALAVGGALWSVALARRGRAPAA